MRAAILLCSGCILLASPSYSVPIKPGNTDEAAVMQLEAIGDRSPEQWQGQQFLTTRITSDAKGSACRAAAAFEHVGVRSGMAPARWL